MHRHPYHMEIDATYTREQIARSMASCRATPRSRIPAGARLGWAAAARRMMGAWLISLGERLHGPRPTVPAR